MKSFILFITIFAQVFLALGAEPTTSVMTDTNNIITRPRGFWQHAATNDPAFISAVQAIVPGGTTSAVTSVQSKVGAVSLTTSEIPAGTNQYFTGKSGSFVWMNPTNGTLKETNVIHSLDPRFYGAAIDGVTVDTAALQAGINNAAKNGGTFELPAGHYKSGPLTITNSVTIRGSMPSFQYVTNQGADLSTLQPGNGTWIDFMGGGGFSGHGLRGVKFENIGMTNFTYMMKFGSDGVEGLSFSRIQDVVGIGSAVLNASDLGVENYNGMFLEINGLRVYNVNTGLREINQNNFVPPGNAVQSGVYVFTYPKSVAAGNNAKPGIDIQSLAPSVGSASGPHDQISLIRPQVNSFGGDGTGIGIRLLGTAASPPQYIAGFSVTDMDVEGPLLYSFFEDYLYNSTISFKSVSAAPGMCYLGPHGYNLQVISSDSALVITNRQTVNNTIFTGTFSPLSYGLNNYIGNKDSDATRITLQVDTNRALAFISGNAGFTSDNVDGTGNASYSPGGLYAVGANSFLNSLQTSVKGHFAIYRGAQTIVSFPTNNPAYIDNGFNFAIGTNLASHSVELVGTIAVGDLVGNNTTGATGAGDAVKMSQGQIVLGTNSYLNSQNLAIKAQQVAFYRGSENIGSISSNSPSWFKTGYAFGFGTDAPTYPVDVVGDINYTGVLRSNGVAVVFGGSGVGTTNVVVPGASTTVTTNANTFAVNAIGPFTNLVVWDSLTLHGTPGATNYLGDSAVVGQLVFTNGLYGDGSHLSGIVAAATGAVDIATSQYSIVNTNSSTERTITPTNTWFIRLPATLQTYTDTETYKFNYGTYFPLGDAGFGIFDPSDALVFGLVDGGDVYFPSSGSLLVVSNIPHFYAQATFHAGAVGAFSGNGAGLTNIPVQANATTSVYVTGSGAVLTNKVYGSNVVGVVAAAGIVTNAVLTNSVYGTNVIGFVPGAIGPALAAGHAVVQIIATGTDLYWTNTFSGYVTLYVVNLGGGNFINLNESANPIANTQTVEAISTIHLDPGDWVHLNYSTPPRVLYK